MEGEFPSLQDHCLYYIITHLDDYSPENELSLLPRHLRHLLLQTVSPVHLVWLERTAVAAGIDTDAVWERFVQHRKEGLHQGWMTQTNLSLSQLHTPKELFLSFVYKKLFATNRGKLILQQFGVKHYDLPLFLFGLSEPVVEEGVLKIARNRPSTLIGQIKSLVFCVPNFRREMNMFESVCCTLLRYNLFPRVLELPLSSRDNLVAIASSNQRAHQLEQLFACSTVTELLSVTLNDRLADDVLTTTKIISGLGKCRETQLSTLQLGPVADNTLSSIVTVLASPNYFLKIKSLQLSLYRATEAFVTPLVEIVHHQKSLKSLSLSFQRTTCGKLQHKLLSSLSLLFTYPNFKEMKLRGLVDFSIAGIISAFLCSPSDNHQTLQLLQERLTLPHGRLNFVDFELPTSDQARCYGHKRDLVLTAVTGPRSFYDWLFSMPSMHLNKLIFRHCSAIADRGQKLNLSKMLEAHPDASVTNFVCKNFSFVQW